MVFLKLLSSTTGFNTDNNSSSKSEYTGMISEGSCDTEDWSNDAENSALPGISYILKYLKIENCYFNL